MVDMCYDAAGMRDAAAGHHELAAGIEPMIVQLNRLVLDSGALGRLPAAAAFAAALDRARLESSLVLARAADTRTDQGNRSVLATDIAESLTGSTTGIASKVTPSFIPGAILAGMN